MPDGVVVQPAVVGASNRNGTSPLNIASSDTPGAPTTAARFATAIVQVATASSCTGLGAALSVTARSTRPAAMTISGSWPDTRFVASATVKLTVYGPTLAPSCGVPLNRPVLLSVTPGGAPLVRV